MSLFCNIPRSNTDPYYRYKMPSAILKIEGKGNGIRTVIVNMQEIMKSLNRPMDYGTKFISFELCTKSIIKDDKTILAGKHEEEAIATCIDKFITIYVLCIKCGNPETVLQTKNNTIAAKCKACGKVYKIVDDHKLSNYIIKSAANKANTTKKASPVKTITTALDTTEWSLDTSESAVNARKQSLISEHKSSIYPQENLLAYINNQPPIDEFLSHITKLQETKGWSNTVVIKYVFVSFFSTRYNFYLKTQYLIPLIHTTKEMMLVLQCLERIVEDNKNEKEAIHFLNGLYEEEIVEEEIITQWYNQLKSNTLKENIKPFIDWCQHAEYEEQ